MVETRYMTTALTRGGFLTDTLQNVGHRISYFSKHLGIRNGKRSTAGLVSILKLLQAFLIY
jgi:hypothetical protein